MVPVRVPTQTRDASGKLGSIDLTFLKSGSTTREEVTRNLATIDTGVSPPNFFWGRWDSSQWRTTAVGFVPPEGERVWRARNLLVEFGPNGVIKGWMVVDDKKLSHQLDLLEPTTNSPVLDLSSPLHAEIRVPFSGQADAIQAGMVLSHEFFEEDRTSPSGHFFSVKTPRNNLLRIAPTPGATYYGPTSDYVPFAEPNLLVTTIYLAKPVSVKHGEKERSVGRKLVLGVDPRTFLLLRHYIAQTKQ
jgi:hypothetical protein